MPSLKNYRLYMHMPTYYTYTVQLNTSNTYVQITFHRQNTSCMLNTGTIPAPQQTLATCKYMYMYFYFCELIISFANLHVSRTYRSSPQLCQCCGIERVLGGGDHHTSLTITAFISHHYIQHGLDALAGSIHQVNILVAARYTISLGDEISYVLPDDLNTTRLRVGAYTYM